jgi:hypothetical protein
VKDVVVLENLDVTRSRSAENVPPDGVAAARGIGSLIEQDRIVRPRDRRDHARQRIGQQLAGAEILYVKRVNAKSGGVMQVCQVRRARAHGKVAHVRELFPRRERIVVEDDFFGSIHAAFPAQPDRVRFPLLGPRVVPVAVVAVRN